MSQAFVRIAATGDFAVGESRAFDVEGAKILICATKDGFFAVENRCTHQLQELEGGKIRGCYIFCPLHGQRFDLKTGEPIGQLTDKPLPTFALKIDGDDILVSPAPIDAPG